MTAYAEKFGLMKHIQFKTTVTNVARKGGGWAVTAWGPAGATTKDFDALVVASGNFQIGKIPQIPGLSSSGMPCDHATTYKNADPYVGKKVVVVGLGESGADICREISDVAASCATPACKNSIVVMLHDDDPVGPCRPRTSRPGRDAAAMEPSASGTSSN